MSSSASHDLPDSSVDSGDLSPPLALRIGLPLLIVLVATFVHWGSFQGEFLFDDLRNIVNNEGIRTLPPTSQQPIGLDRRPVGQWSLAINYALHGVHPWGYHAFNLAVHLAAGLFLFGVVRRALRTPTGGARDQRSSCWLALVVALIWIVHPLQTESVTYVIQRLEALMGMFFLATLYFTLRGAQARRGGWLWYVLAVVACWLGLGSKEVMAMAPLVVLLFDRLFLARSWRETVRHRGWMYAGFGVGLVWLGVHLVPSFSSDNNPGAGLGYQAISPLEYFVTQPGVILHYVRLSVWPDALCLDYNWRIARTWSEIAVPAAVLTVVLLSGLALLRVRPAVGFLIIAFFLILAPTSSFVPIADLAFEHRMYLPLAPLVCLVVFGLDAWVRFRESRGIRRRPLVVAALVVALLLLSGRTIIRQLDYRSSVAMWTSVVNQVPHNYRAHYNLAVAYHGVGNRQREMRHYRNAIMLFPGHYLAHFNLANRLVEEQQYAQAAKHYRAAIDRQPDAVDANTNLGWALERQGKLEAALAGYDRALAAEPSFTPAIRGKARCYSLQGETRLAVDHYWRAIELAPQDAAIHVGLGNHFARQEQFAEAIQRFQAALRLDPQNHSARKSLKIAQQRLASG